jgi:small subunit ribosomal protein S5
MPEFIDEASQLESTTIGVFRTAATVKGGRRFSFSSMVVAGDRNGAIGWGYGKANEVPPAIEKAQKEAKRGLRKIPLHGGTIPHEVIGRYGATKVKLMPASPGTGVVAGAAVRAVLEMLGVTDCLTKCYGSTNKINVVKAAMDGLDRLSEPAAVAKRRGVEIGETEVDDMLERGKAFLPAESTGEKMEAPVNTIGRDRQRGGGRGRRGGGGRGQGRGRDAGASSPPKGDPKANAPSSEQPKPDTGGQSAEQAAEKNPNSGDS